MYYKFATEYQVIFVAGHTDVIGNELAYELTRSTAAAKMLGSEPFFAVGPSTLKRVFWKAERAERDKYWQHTSPAIKSVKLVAITTGNCRLKKHLDSATSSQKLRSTYF